MIIFQQRQILRGIFAAFGAILIVLSNFFPEEGYIELLDRRNQKWRSGVVSLEWELS